MTTVRKRVADLTIGPIEARVEASEVAAYVRATSVAGLPASEGKVPATFPAIWLWHPLAAEAISSSASADSSIPVLTAQRFDYQQVMVVGQTYRFTIERFRGPEDQAEVTIEARVHDLDGALAATVSASYRLFPLAEESVA